MCSSSCGRFSANPIPGKIAGSETQTRTSIRSLSVPTFSATTGSASSSLFTQVGGGVGIDQFVVLIRSSCTVMLLLQSPKMIVRRQISSFSTALVTLG